MATAGYLEYDAVGKADEPPDELVCLVASEGTDHFVGGLCSMTPVPMSVVPTMAQAFETGGGVRFEE